MEKIIESHARNAYEMFLKTYYGENTANQEKLNELLSEYLEENSIFIVAEDKGQSMEIRYYGLITATAAMEVSVTKINFRIKYYGGKKHEEIN